MSPHEKQPPRRAVVQPSRTVTPELSDVSSASEQAQLQQQPPLLSSSVAASPPTSPLLAATSSMCIYCFDVLIHELVDHHRYPSVAAQRTLVVPPELESYSKLNRHENVNVNANANANMVVPECPLFITWDKQKPSSTAATVSSCTQFELRGCIGTLQPKPMTAATFQDYALTAGLRDRRFTKISWSELVQLRVAVSLLVQFEECATWDDWTVGVHGIVIRFSQHAAAVTTNSRSAPTTTEPEFSATYLPEVAQEQGWDQMAAVKSLIRKAGYRGTIDQALLQRVHCTRYQSSKTRMTYEEYVQATSFDPLHLVGPSGGGGGGGGDHPHHHHHAMLAHAPGWNTCNNL